MARVEFQDFSVQVKDALDDAVIAFLEEAGSELESQTKRNQTRVDSGETKGQWTHVVDESKHVCTVGNPLENAIWEEFGTGEYALEGNGRKGGWAYQDEKGDWYFTHGKKPSRAFFKAYTALKSKIINHIQNSLKGL